jgi:hypothetical protein
MIALHGAKALLCFGLTEKTRNFPNLPAMIEIDVVQLPLTMNAP